MNHATPARRIVPLLLAIAPPLAFGMVFQSTQFGLLALGVTSAVTTSLLAISLIILFRFKADKKLAMEALIHSNLATDLPLVCSISATAALWFYAAA